MSKIILTGGGTAGHVTPNIALIPALREAGFTPVYIGSYNGIEKDLITKEGLEYHGISSGKLRRYFDWKNFSDPFRVLRGYAQARSLLKRIRPAVVFSKGGFVSVPVVLAAKSLHIPAILHESDMTPGLANRIAMKGAVKICCNFPETLSYLPEGKGVLTGSPIRQALLHGSRDKALEFTGLTGARPLLLIIGGSLGSVFINNAVRGALDDLLRDFEIIHLCGKGNLDPTLDGRSGYVQYEYISKELPDLFAAADLVISRAGANAICELLALRKPNILIPLSRNASRGDQILNAASFAKQGFSYVIEEEDVTEKTLTDAIRHVTSHRDEYIKAMSDSAQMDPIQKIVAIIKEAADKQG
ncbi:MAG: undecaprenyldiphospho-muramoylpentapeptide beta-N-acetylglucosaminyltransferase [Lachnospiraceae bacterium]|nr:undecaprenyldiphospho-muramoylpentapeptide beta-N-acetylglucosaminyltransferase [Lachnospiraceae bacterium]